MIYRFGDFSINDDTRQLLSKDGELHLSPKAFELLMILIFNRSRVVSKTELQDRLWPETFVEETNVAGLVAEVRRMLRDTASTPSFIRTMHRIGYRFIGDVHQDAGTPGVSVTRSRLCLMQDERRLILMEGPNTIGRAAEATILIDSPGVSRLHARVVVENGTARLEDLGSKNGTHLNGTRLTEPQVLADGDEIRVGTIVLIFRSEFPSDTTETVGG